MIRGLVWLEAIFLVFLIHVIWNNITKINFFCSREKSRMARTIINKKVTPIFERYRVEMTIECPFHPQRDFLWWFDSEIIQELNSFHDYFNQNLWQCPICGDTFFYVENLLSHWDNKHKDIMDVSEDYICLGDFCDIMRCDTTNNKKSKNKFKRWRTNLNQLEQEENKTCNSSEMALLEKKCHSIIRQCIVPLFVNQLPLKDFNEFENELFKTTCSFLNCDKFLSDYSKEIPAISLTLCIILGSIIIVGFFICYFIVWLFFEKPSLHSQKDKEIKNKDEVPLYFSSTFKHKRVLKKTESCDFYQSRPHNLIIYKNAPYRRSSHRIFMNSSQSKDSPSSTHSSYYNSELKSIPNKIPIKSYKPMFGEVDEIRKTPSGRKILLFNYNLKLGSSPTKSISNQPLTSHSMQFNY